MFVRFILVLFLSLVSFSNIQAEEKGFVALMNMDMMILPGTQGYLENVILKAEEDGAKAIVVQLDTPGGIITTSQEMIQAIFKSKVPVIVYVYPSGSTATSAGVFITMAGHIAAMAPGTTIGAAHPVAGDGKDIEGDMRLKAENMTIAMVRSISEERGRNVEWAEESVKKSSSLTENEALKKNVVDIVTPSIIDLLRDLKGRKIELDGKEVVLEDYSNLPIKNIEISVQNKILNVMANPNIAALLWLGATSGISLELYNPGAILPGVVGVICLLLALAVTQVIPITQTGILLMVAGGLMIGAEMYVASGILGVGGIIAMIFGAIYLVDPIAAPDLKVNLEMIIPVILLFGGFMLWVLREVIFSRSKNVSTGQEGMIGEVGKAEQDFTVRQSIFINGESWNASLIGAEASSVKKGADLEVVAVHGLLLDVKVKE